MIKLDSYLTLSRFTPKSTNNLYFCLYIDEKTKRRIIVKDDWYRDWRAFFTAILPNDFLPNDVSNIGLYIEVGIMEEFDVDNTLKGIIDALQFRYGFNDNQLKSLIAKKIPTRKFKRHGARENYKDFIKIGTFKPHLIDIDDTSAKAYKPVFSPSNYQVGAGMKSFNAPKSIKPSTSFSLSSGSYQDIEIGKYVPQPNRQYAQKVLAELKDKMRRLKEDDKDFEIDHQSDDPSDYIPELLYRYLEWDWVSPKGSEQENGKFRPVYMNRPDFIDENQQPQIANLVKDRNWKREFEKEHSDGNFDEWKERYLNGWITKMDYLNALTYLLKNQAVKNETFLDELQSMHPFDEEVNS